jgi:hypothetical protein
MCTKGTRVDWMGHRSQPLLVQEGAQNTAIGLVSRIECKKNGARVMGAIYSEREKRATSTRLQRPPVQRLQQLRDHQSEDQRSPRIAQAEFGILQDLPQQPPFER